MIYDVQRESFLCFLSEATRGADRLRAKRAARYGPTREHMTLNFCLYG